MIANVLHRAGDSPRSTLVDVYSILRACARRSAHKPICAGQIGGELPHASEIATPAKPGASLQDDPEAAWNENAAPRARSGN